MQDDSNGESSFEFVDKKMDENSSEENASKTGSLSNRSSPSMATFPSASSSSSATGNILSSAPPSFTLPSFVSHPPSDSVPKYPQLSQVGLSQKADNAPVSGSSAVYPNLVGISQLKPITPQTFHPTTFSAAIPSNKGTSSAVPVNPPATPVTEVGSGFLGWVKGAVGNGEGLLHKVAEKAKSSLDSMITTLDPQMKEFLYSGGDVDIVVASDKDVKVNPVREAFQNVFGRATVVGIGVQTSNTAVQPVGFNFGVGAAEERISNLRASHKVPPNQAIIAVENFIVEVSNDKWYDVGVIVLSDPQRQINLQTFTQFTPVPVSVVNLAKEDTPKDYPLTESGFSVTIGSLMASNLQVHHTEWHKALTGVSRRDMLYIAAKSLAGLYKGSIGPML